MNIGTIINPNTKGQIVIPQKIRNLFGITENTPLQIVVTGESIVLYPIQAVVRDIDVEDSYGAVLKKTLGAWAGDDWKQTEAKRHTVEKKAAARRKAAW